MEYTKKTIFIILAFVILSIVLNGCSQKRNNFDNLVVEGSELRVYEVFGMDCPGCHGGLENLVNEISGVIKTQAHWERKLLKVIVSNNSQVTDEMIFEAIKKANFLPGKRLK